MGKQWSRVAVLVVAGVLTTVAVAWTLRLDVHLTRRALKFARAGESAGGAEISVARRESWGAVSLTAAVPGFEPTAVPQNQFVDVAAAVPGWAEHELLDWARGKSVAPTSAARGVLGTGWPCVAMWSSFDQQPSGGYWWFQARDGIVVGAAPPSPVPGALLTPSERVLPVRIAWVGFVVDAALWAGVWGAFWWVAGAGVPRMRCAMRSRRGRCVWCGYDKRGLVQGVCPECGRP